MFLDQFNISKFRWFALCSVADLQTLASEQEMTSQWP